MTVVELGTPLLLLAGLTAVTVSGSGGSVVNMEVKGVVSVVVPLLTALVGMVRV